VSILPGTLQIRQLTSCTAQVSWTHMILGHMACSGGQPCMMLGKANCRLQDTLHRSHPMIQSMFKWSQLQRMKVNPARESVCWHWSVMCVCVCGHSQQHHCLQSIELMAQPPIQVHSYYWFTPNSLLTVIYLMCTGEVCKDNDFSTCGGLLLFSVHSLIFSVAIFKNKLLYLLYFYICFVNILSTYMWILS
jgi:hypothetical protein